MPDMEKLGTIKAREKPLQRESGAPSPNNLNLGLVGSMAGNVILPAKSPVIHVDEKGIEEVRQALQACAGQYHMFMNDKISQFLTISRPWTCWGCNQQGQLSPPHFPCRAG